MGKLELAAGSRIRLNTEWVCGWHAPVPRFVFLLRGTRARWAHYRVDEAEREGRGRRTSDRVVAGAWKQCRHSDEPPGPHTAATRGPHG
jgi:hypothetical protein